MTIAKAKLGELLTVTRRGNTLADDVRIMMRELAQKARSISFPSDKYQRKYCGFARDILGMELDKPQVRILEACEEHDRVAVSSGHKIGKSTCAAIVALCDYSSWDDMRVVLTSTTDRQVNEILWRELMMQRARSGVCASCKERDRDQHPDKPHLWTVAPCEHSAIIDGIPGQLAKTGLTSGFRQVYGFSAKEAEAVAGISGAHVRFIADEASGIPRVIFEAIEGNRAGGASLLMFSNPTKNEGEFFEAFHSKSKFYKTLTVSSEETANAITGRRIFPGLAEASWIQEKREEWGEDSALYKIRVKGEFVLSEESKIFSVHLITEATKRWDITEPSGRLWIGVDPAGESGSGDDTALVARRGLKVLKIRRVSGLDESQVLMEILSLMSEFGGTHDGKKTVVVIDREGSVGHKLYLRINEYLDLSVEAFHFVPLRASDMAQRNPQVYDKVRDEIANNLEGWFSSGGAIPDSTKLPRELNSLTYAMNAKGRVKLSSKREIRKLIGRSPDEYDALSLACWEPLEFRADSPRVDAASIQKATSEAAVLGEERDGPPINPYDSAEYQ